jgi:catechol 2,3-dioxygenase-like lactoylglutathione lyase family enzyme
MAGTGPASSTSTEMPETGTIDMKLDVVTVPVSDVDRAKRFYQGLGWRLDVDLVLSDDIRAVQLTPRRSGCSVAFGTGLTTAEPGSAQRFGELLPGPDPERRSYLTFASFSDPDGNGWLLQEVTTRLPGREWDD